MRVRIVTRPKTLNQFAPTARARLVGAGYCRVEVPRLRVRAHFTLIILGSPSEFYEKCVEFDSRRLQVIKKQCLLAYFYSLLLLNSK